MQVYSQKLVGCWQVRFENNGYEYTARFHVENWLLVSTQVKLNNLYNHFKIILLNVKI